jgi:hypothetical protein
MRTEERQEVEFNQREKRHGIVRAEGLKDRLIAQGGDCDAQYHHRHGNGEEAGPHGGQLPQYQAGIDRVRYQPKQQRRK